MEKTQQERKEHGPGPGGPAAHRPLGPPLGEPGERLHGPMSALTPEEREKLEAAREKIKDNAQVKAAHEKQEEAVRAFRDALHAATLAADPSVEPLLEKVGPRGGHGRGGENPFGAQKPPHGKAGVVMPEDADARQNPPPPAPTQ